MYRLMRNKVGGIRYIQGAWGMGNKHGWRTDDLVGAGDTGCVAETRYTTLNVNSEINMDFG